MSARVAAAFALLAWLLFLPGGTPGGGAAAAAAVSQPGLRLGVHLPDPGTLNSFEAMIGRPVDIVLWYESINNDLDTDLLGPAAANGKTIQLSWEPWDLSNPDPVNQPAYRLKNITRGDFDADIHRWAREIRDFGAPVLFRPMCEMNGNWTSWSGTVNGNSPADYVPAWRHIHDIFVQEGAANVKFVWSPNVDGTTAEAINTFNSYYPGDAYVDYVGMNGYNWGTLYNTATWVSVSKTFTEIFGPSYDVFAARTGKPMMVSETASTEIGADKPAWITDTFAELPVRFPRIVNLTWFNAQKETDWRVQSSAASLAAFRAAVAIPDSQPPAVSFKSPSPGGTLSGNATVTVSASDNVAVSRVALYAGDRLVATSTTSPFKLGFATRALADGNYSLTVKAWDFAGNSSTAQENIKINNSGDRDYYFGWYDDASPGISTWVILSNPGSATEHAEIYIGGALAGAFDIGAGQHVTPMFAGVCDGPVKVAVTTGGGLLVSERTLYNGSFSEVPAASGDGLAADHYLSWYDEQSPGMRSWVVIANEDSQAASVEVSMNGQPLGQYTVPAGGRITPEFPGVMGGPLEVSSTNGKLLSVSERVVYSSSFNEASATPAPALSSEYFFPWYDEQTPGMHTWIVVGNQDSQPAIVDIYVAGRLLGRYNVPARGSIAPDFPGVMEGPVRVIATGGQPLVVSQRSVYNSSFEETRGTANSGLLADQWFPWYDNASPGMTTWVVVGNQGPDAAAVSISIAGVTMGSYQIPPGGRIAPRFPGQLNGPVEVKGAAGQKLVVSQRTTYYGSFDEVGGRGIR